MTDLIVYGGIVAVALTVGAFTSKPVNRALHKTKHAVVRVVTLGHKK